MLCPAAGARASRIKVARERTGGRGQARRDPPESKSNDTHKLSCAKEISITALAELGVLKALC